MAIYEYAGKTYELADGISNEMALSKIKASLGESPTPPVQSAPATPASNGAPDSSFLMGLKDPISGGAQLLPRGLEQLTSVGGIVPNMMSRFFGSEADRVDAMVKQEQAAFAAQREASGGSGIDFGRVAGNILNPANLLGGVRAAPVIAGAIQGALQPATSDNFAQEKATQVGFGAVGGRVGELVAKGAGRVLSPLQSKAEATMRELGVTPTMGQTLGGVARRAEDFAQNLPLVGGSIRTARERVLFNFNKGVINKALAKVDDKLPASVVGRDAVAYAAEQVSNKYDDVLGKMSFNLDFKTTSGILKALDTAPLSSAAQREQASTILNNTVLSRFSGEKLTGAQYKAIESDLSKQASSYSSSSTAAEREVGQALKGVLNVFKKELYQQNPKFTSQLRRVDSAFGDLKVMEKAAASGGAINGVFTPAQYSAAVRQADQSRGKSRFARGQARNQDVSEAAIDVIGKDASSTLEGRLAMGGLGGIAVFSQPQLAIPAAIATGAAYSPIGSRVTDALLRSRAPAVSQFGQQVRRAAPAAGMLSSGLALDASR